MDFKGSDHRPVLLQLLSSQQSYRGQFRFDKRFLFKPLVEEAVSKAWFSSGSSSGSTATDRLRACRKSLSSLKKNNCTNSNDKIQQMEAALEVVQSSCSPVLEHVRFLKRELARAYRDEETFWSQKSSEKWMRGGDKNTSFFHATVKGKRSKNRIEKLLDVDGIEQKSEAAKGEVACAYFQTLFTSSNPASFANWFRDF